MSTTKALTDVAQAALSAAQAIQSTIRGEEMESHEKQLREIANNAITQAVATTTGGEPEKALQWLEVFAAAENMVEAIREQFGEIPQKSVSEHVPTDADKEYAANRRPSHPVLHGILSTVRWKGDPTSAHKHSQDHLNYMVDKGYLTWTAESSYRLTEVGTNLLAQYEDNETLSL